MAAERSVSAVRAPTAQRVARPAGQNSGAPPANQDLVCAPHERTLPVSSGHRTVQRGGKLLTVPARDDLAAVLDSVSDLIGGVADEQWNAPTPCPEWDVRLLVNHMVLGHRLFSGILRGTTTVSTSALDPSTGNVLGDNPADTYRRAANDVLAAFAQPGVLEREFLVPVGVVPGIAAVHLRAVEERAQGWDLARATAQRPPFSHDLVERQLEFTRTKLADVPSDQSPFAPPQPAPGDAPPLDRLAALLGRRVSPRP